MQGPCEGDNGGPLYIENVTETGDITDRTVVGLVSAGIGCGANPDKKPNFPKLFARVGILIHLGVHLITISINSKQGIFTQTNFRCSRVWNKRART